MPNARTKLVPLVGALLFGVFALAAHAQQEPQARIEQIQQQMKIQHIAQERPPQAEYAARDFLRRVAFADEIENVEVIKGPAATATYGPKAANGVILIKTKRGRAGAARVTSGDTFRGPPSVAPLYVVDGVVVEPPPMPNGGGFVPIPDSLILPVVYLDSLRGASPNDYWQEVGQLTVQSEMAGEVMRRDTARGRAMERMFAIEFDARGLQRGYRGADDSKRLSLRSQLEQLMSRHFDIETQLMQLEVADATRRLSAVSAELGKRPGNRAEQVRAMVDGILRDATRP